MDTCIRMVESFRCSPETIITLLIGYTPIQNKKLKKKVKSEKPILYINTYMQNLEKWFRYSFCPTEMETKMLSTKVWTPRREEGCRRNWEIGIGIYTLLILCIKQVTNENILQRFREPYSVLDGDLNGKVIQKRGNICIHIADSLYCTGETNTTL